MKKKVHISQCAELDILFEDIVSQYGTLILPKGAVINEYIIQKLKEFGIEYVYIFDRNREKIFPDYESFEERFDENIDKIKYLMNEIIRGKKLDYNELNRITDDVIVAWDNPEYVMNYLKKIHDKDDYTYYHCINVSFYSALIASYLKLPKEEIKTVIQAALLHDLGKVKIPLELLNKKEKLTVEEFNEIKKHAVYGYEIVKNDDEILDAIKDVILMHHEREDKSGYPLGLSGEELSIYSKIVSVADVYDAMTSNRPYRKALTPFDAFNEFVNISRNNLDIRIVNILTSRLSSYYTGSQVLLNNGEVGRIVYIPPHCIQKPVVSIGKDFVDLSKEDNISIIKMI
ncbi:MAG: HD-GYP domain-containing protein [Epulopiscium sp.]|jgi:putative nucleotidyltransferase with HDIG domain|nr:HD-GYP domain-containing protein [Candidatus Epulonipiscium sp.]